MRIIPGELFVFPGFILFLETPLRILKFISSVNPAGLPISELWNMLKWIVVFIFLLNGIAWAEGGGHHVFCIQEEDGSPKVWAPWKIIVSNGTLTDNGDGTVTLQTGGAAAQEDALSRSPQRVRDGTASLSSAHDFRRAVSHVATAEGIPLAGGEGDLTGRRGAEPAE